VEDLFGKYGRLKHVKLGTNRNTGQSKGFAFVTYESRADAEEAYEKFNNYEVEAGRRLRVDWDVGLDKKGTPGRRDRDSDRDRDRDRDRNRDRDRDRDRDSRRDRSRSPRRSPKSNHMFSDVIHVL
jgi:RNA recognition motif-containing protein